MSSMQDAVGKLSEPFRIALGLQYHPFAQHFARTAMEFEKLRHLSGRSAEELKIHLGSWPGSIISLTAFYARHGCFPSEMEGGV